MSFAPPIANTDVDQPAPARPWSLTWKGRTFHESQLTGKHLSVLALIVGNDDFSTLDVSPLAGHQRIMMMLAAFLVVDAKLEGDTEANAAAVAEIMASIAESPAEEILGALHVSTSS